MVGWRRIPDEIQEDFNAAFQATQTAQVHLHDHGVYAAISALTFGAEVPGSSSLGEALASVRTDRRAVDALSALVYRNLQYGDELTDEVLPLAGWPIEAASTLIPSDHQP